MRRIFKSCIFRNVTSAILLLVIIFVGVIKINIINTKALSPLGNTNENYKLVSTEFGEDFSNFIKDNSFLKIYQESQNDILVRLGDSDFRINDESVFIKKVQDLFSKIKL